MAKLTGKVAVVTGASKGIGAAIAKELAAQGASVVVNYASSKEGADKVVGDIVAAGGKAVAIGGSVAKPAEIETLFAETKKQFGHIDILVNNAGVYSMSSIEQITEEIIDSMFSINVTGLLLVTKAALALFPQGGGSIVNIGSIASEQGAPTMSAYNGTKGAVDSITRTLAKELGPKNIRVNAVNPGLTVTEGSSAFSEGEFANAAIAQTPLGRLGQPGDIGPVVAFLASDDARWVTGSLLQVAGGLR